MTVSKFEFYFKKLETAVWKGVGKIGAVRMIHLLKCWHLSNTCAKSFLTNSVRIELSILLLDRVLLRCLYFPPTIHHLLQGQTIIEVNVPHFFLNTLSEGIFSFSRWTTCWSSPDGRRAIFRSWRWRATSACRSRCGTWRPKSGALQISKRRQSSAEWGKSNSAGCWFCMWK